MSSELEEANRLLDDTDITPDLSEWMTNLPDYATNIPINQIVIPGSHDSGAFWLDADSPVCPSNLFSFFITLRQFRDPRF